MVNRTWNHFINGTKRVVLQIRKKLKEKELYFPDQKKKPYQNPTARWVFQCFQGITVIYLGDQSPMEVNWKERQQVIIDCLGENYRQIYS